MNLGFRITAAFLLLATAGCGNKEQPQDKKIENPETGAFTNNISHPQELKALEWFLGEWVDDDPRVDFSSKVSWDKHGHFMIESFSIKTSLDKTSGDTNFEGQQIIGWDPDERKIRSWIFDSDGGFGESTWVNEGDSWYASTTFTLPDGRKASALHVYTKVGENGYTFSSSDRDVGGKWLPNIGPYKIDKKS